MKEFNGYIYKITSKSSGRIYVGKTINIEARFKKHLNDLKAKRHDNSIIQNCYEKYGPEDFIFEILKNCSSEKELNEEENKEIILAGFPNKDFCFNLKSGGDGCVLSEETKNKIRKSLTGLKHTQERAERNGRTHSKKVVCVDTGEVFNSALEAANFKKLKSSNIISVCKKKKHCNTAGGFKWEYYENFNNG